MSLSFSPSDSQQDASSHPIFSRSESASQSSTQHSGTVYIGGKPVGASDAFQSIPAGFTAFTAAQIERPSVAPKTKKTPRPLRTKAEWTAISMESDEQRKARQAQERADKVAKILRPNSHSDIGRNFPGQADRTNVITGRRISARHQ